MGRRSSSSANPPRPQVLAFLKDIKENPDDDTPRLVLADWLEEQGDPRGEFVRLQCQRQQPGQESATAWPTNREVELLETHGNQWRGVLAKKGVDTEFERGMVQVWGGVRSLLSKQLAALWPTEELAWVDSLCIRDMNAEAVARLAQSPHWTCLSSLDLSGSFYYADHLAGQFTPGVGPQGGVALAAVPVLAQVRELVLRCNDIGAQGMAALAAIPNLERLQTLDLSCNNLGDEGGAALASSRSLTGLTRLYLNQNRLGSEGVAALAQWPGLSKLTTLSLWENYFRAEGATALAASPYLGCLTELHLGGSEERGYFIEPGPGKIGPEGAAALSKSLSLTRLARLNLWNNFIGPEGTAALAATRTLTGLVELNLSRNEVGDRGAIALASSPALSHLVRLELRCNNIGNQGALALAASTYLTNLKYLNLRANREIGSAGLRCAARTLRRCGR